MQNIKCDLKIAWATHDAAKFACENWHYSKKMPVNKTVKVGAWEDKKFIGVVIFSPGATPALYKTYNIPQTNGCELTRVALTKHKTPVSKILTMALKFLKKSNPGMRLVISFADTKEGHHGGIYQATNWIYVGEASPRKLPKINGKFIHERSLSVLVKNGKIKRDQCEWVKAMPKHKYLMPLDDDMRKQIEPLKKPYPKRVELENKASTFQVEESGAVPTSALQLNKIVEQPDKTS
jgi:hypothetical protein